MALSHRQIQDFVHAFNQGELQLEITYHITRIDNPESAVRSRLKTYLAARVRPENEPRVVIKNEGDHTPQYNDVRMD